MMSNGKKKHLVVIPAYNEERTIAEVVRRASAYADVCVIDDHSSDATPEILARFNDIHVINHQIRTHLPGGVLDGMRYAVSEGYDYVITMDAGLSHNPDEIPGFIDYGPADLLIGMRTQCFGKPLGRRLLSNTGNFVYNACLDFPASVFSTRRYRDLTSGFRRYSKRSLDLLTTKPIRSKSFDVLLETVMYIHRYGLSIAEIPITYVFSNTSLNLDVIKDCMNMSLSLMLGRRR